MVTFISELIMYKTSKDNKMITAGIKVHTGENWQGAKEEQVTEERLRHKTILGKVTKS